MKQTNNYQIVLSPAHLITIVVAMAGLMMLTVLLTTNMIVNSETVSAKEHTGYTKGAVSAATQDGCEGEAASSSNHYQPAPKHTSKKGHVLGLSTSYGQGGDHHKTVVSYKQLFKPAHKHQDKKVVKRVVHRSHKVVKNSYNTYNKSHEETNNYIEDSVVNQTQVSAGDYSSVNVNNVAADDSLVFQKNENNTNIEDNDVTVTTNTTDNSVNDSYNTEIDTEIEDSFNKEKKVEDSYNTNETTNNTTNETNLDVEVDIEDSFNEKNIGLLPRSNGPVLAD